MNTPTARLQAVRSRIAAACRSAGRDPADVSLLAVSKRHSPERVMAFHRLGLVNFGENQYQTANTTTISTIGREPARIRGTLLVQRGKMTATSPFLFVEKNGG